MKRLVVALAAVSLSMMGCGGSLCQDFADSLSTINDKVEDCPSFEDFDFDEPSDSEIEACEENLDKCSDADKEALEKFVDCVNDLDKCEASDEDAFATLFVLCAAPLENVSESCGDATNPQSVPGKALAYSKAYSKAR
ncbi:MAG TPA: hypothetical protein VF815_25465 [Myxococcaceae bacterium]|jgi:hypothetical protein